MTSSDSRTQPRLTVIIPAYNERDTVLAVIERVRALPVSKEIIVVDNCSTDGTRELLASLPQQEGLIVVLQPANYGKGTSVRTGIARASGEFVVVQDADLEYNPDDLLRLLGKAEEGHDAVFGTRLAERTSGEGGSRAFALGRRFVTKWFNRVYGTRLTDVATCYKLMRRERIAGIRLVASGFDLDFEIPAKLVRSGIDIVEVPISYSPRGAAEGKKLTWRDGLRALRAILAHRFTKL